MKILLHIICVTDEKPSKKDKKSKKTKVVVSDDEEEDEEDKPKEKATKSKKKVSDTIWLGLIFVYIFHYFNIRCNASPIIIANT